MYSKPDMDLELELSALVLTIHCTEISRQKQESSAMLLRYLNEKPATSTLLAMGGKTTSRKERITAARKILDSFEWKWKGAQES